MKKLAIAFIAIAPSFAFSSTAQLQSFNFHLRYDGLFNDAWFSGQPEIMADTTCELREDDENTIECEQTLLPGSFPGGSLVYTEANAKAVGQIKEDGTFQAEYFHFIYYPRTTRIVSRRGPTGAWEYDTVIEGGGLRHGTRFSVSGKVEDGSIIITHIGGEYDYEGRGRIEFYGTPTQSE